MRIVTIGEEILDRDIARARGQLSRFGLSDVKLNIVQGSKNLDANELKTLLVDPTLKQADRNAKLLASEQQRVALLEKELAPYKNIEGKAQSVSKEMKALFPEASHISIAQTQSLAVSDSGKPDSVMLVHLTLTKKISADSRKRMENWLSARLNTTKLVMLTSIVEPQSKTKK